MSEGTAIGISQDQLQELLRTVLAQGISQGIAQSQKMNPLEQKKYEEEMEKERRRDRLAVELAMAEDRKDKAKQFSCTHRIYPNGHKKAGHNAPPGEGEWNTSGQIHGNGTATVLCQRCASIWTFKAMPDEIESLRDGGMLGVPVPPAKRVLSKHCGTCHLQFTEEDFAKHEFNCRVAYEMRMIDIEKQRKAEKEKVQEARRAIKEKVDAAVAAQTAEPITA